MSDELYHHGILGMKWGVRRFQNEDGTLTGAGRKRYSVGIEEQKKRVKNAKAEERTAKRQFQKEYYTRFGMVSKDTTAAYKSASEKTDWERRKLADERTKEALNRSGKKKSKHRLALEQKYMEKGMSAEEAEIAAYKRIRTERAIAIAGGVTLAAAAAYVAYKHWDLNADKVLKNVELKNISDTDNLDISRQFYAAYKKGDVKKYLGLYGGQLSDKVGEVHQTTIGIKDKLNVAGRKTAVKALADMVGRNNDIISDLRSDLQSYRTKVAAASPPAGRALANRAEKDLSKGKITKSVYDVLNSVQTLGKEKSNAGKMLYSELTKAGYDAIIDVNDKKYSGYNSKSPLIVFNGAEKVMKKSVRDVSRTEVWKHLPAEMAKVQISAYLKAQAPWAATWAAGYATVKGVKAHKNKQSRDRIVAEYRREHPDKKLTYNQIVDNYYGSK